MSDDLRAYLAKLQICSFVWVIPQFRTKQMKIEKLYLNEQNLFKPSMNQEEEDIEQEAEELKVRCSGSAKGGMKENIKKIWS